MTVSSVPTLDSLRTRTRAVLAGLFGPEIDDLPADAPLPETLGDRYDSLGAMECVTAMEKEFGIEVDFVEHDVRYTFAQMDRIAEFVHAQLEDQAAFGGPR
ncbi:acyl carrier protein [Amycolatopsis sp. BJA-103]|uniref:acyl carrier protein n=1 Tax=unclassified Amycolatopsis TaxID=2618356 RepID=UPI000C783D3B|nr:acyl carrier protein [Amycolatopsis sp. BJA-103]AUI58253.1 acyl carrier protein [Amycolatopsis sp. BJA-103]PNE14885.1 acyl carrier protein [Amycolatopsis sp. BJA-103]